MMESTAQAIAKIIFAFTNNPPSRSRKSKSTKKKKKKKSFTLSHKVLVPDPTLVPTSLGATTLHDTDHHLSLRIVFAHQWHTICGHVSISFSLVLQLALVDSHN
jgi:hypothetical protein